MACSSLTLKNGDWLRADARKLKKIELPRGACPPFSTHREDHRRMALSTQLNTAERLHDLLATRILILDGAMGTMIQPYKLGESEFRGSQFADHPRNFSLKGFNDLLCLTQPGIISEIHRQYF